MRRHGRGRLRRRHLVQAAAGAVVNPGLLSRGPKAHHGAIENSVGSMLDLATPPASVKIWSKSRPLIDILSQTAGPITRRQHQLLLLPPGPAEQQPTLPELENSEANPTDFRCTSPRATAAAAPPAPRVRSHCRFRNRGTDYVRESGMKWMNASTKRQCDRALPSPPPRTRMHSAWPTS